MGDVHVIPVGDLREHIEDDRCWCGPTRDAATPLLVVHHAADLREHGEPAGAAPEPARG